MDDNTNNSSAITMKPSYGMIDLYITDKVWIDANLFTFSIRVFFHDTDDWRDSRGREGTIFLSTLQLPPAHEHSDIYLQLCMWHGYHIFLIASFVFTRLLLDEIYHLIELSFDWLCDIRFLFVYVMIWF